MSVAVDWEPLEAAVSVILDHRGMTPKKLGSEFVPYGIPVASAMLVKDGLIDLTDARFVNDETYQKWMPEPLQKGDVILTSEAPLGRVAQVDTNSPLVLGQRLFALRGRSGHLDSRYLYYALQSSRVSNDIQSRATGTTVLGIRQSALRQVKLPIRPICVQQAIAEVLGALDDKIAANRKLVTTIDELSSAIYKESANTERALSSMASFVNGRNFTKNATGDGRVVVRIAELNSGIGNSTVRNRVDNAADDNLVRPGDILFAWSGSLTLHRWTQPEALVNQHIFKVIPNSDVPPWLAYQAVKVKLPEFKAIAANKATTMGHIQRHDLDTAVAVPSPDRAAELDPVMSSLWKRAITADKESRTLADLRDTLLPALMDGTLRVKDAEKQAEEAL